MSEERAPDPPEEASGSVRSPTGADVGRALLSGFLAFLAVGALGQLIALAEWLPVRSTSAFSTFARIGWVYFLTFHGVGLDVGANAFPFGIVDCGAPCGSGGAAYRVHVTFMLGTAAAAYLLYRAGRAAAARSHGSARRRLLLGAAVAPSYALPALLISLALPLRGFLGLVDVEPVPWQAFTYPFVLALVAGAAGGVSSVRTSVSSRWGTRAIASFAGGWRMFALAIVFAFLGLIVLAGVRPDGAAAYWRQVSDGGLRRTSLIVGHHALLSPNQSMFLLAPAMGSCDRATLPHSTQDLLCFGRQPVATWVAQNGFFGAHPTSSDSVPPAYYLFVLVPIAAAVFGGRRAGRASEEPLIVGLGAGLVFAVLVAIGCVAASFTVRGVFDASGTTRTVVIGPVVARTTLLAIAWGVAGGMFGAVLAARRPAGWEPGSRQLPEDPSPTSV